MTTAYGLAVRGAPVIGAGVADDTTPTGYPLDVTLADAGAVDAAFSGSRDPAEIAYARLDGEPWSVERGRAGDLRMAYGAHARFHLDPDARVLSCASRDPEDPSWQRVLLDSALTTASLARGFDALHAGAVVMGGGALAILGGSGAGKTTLVAELVRRGHRLLADDVLALSRGAADVVLGHPAPHVMNVRVGEADGLGRVLHRFGSEEWVLVEPAATAPVPLRTVVLLERGAGGEPALEPVAAPGPVLLAHALDVGRDAARQAQRFDLLADLAATAAVHRLRSRPGAAASHLADLLES